MSMQIGEAANTAAAAAVAAVMVSEAAAATATDATATAAASATATAEAGLSDSIVLWRLQTWGCMDSSGLVSSRNQWPFHLDVLVEIEGTHRFAQCMDLKFLLEDKCGAEVDLVTKDALRPALKAKIVAEAKCVA